MPGIRAPARCLRNLSAIVSHFDAATPSERSLAELVVLDANNLPHVKGSPCIGPCAPRTQKMACTGLNYLDRIHNDVNDLNYQLKPGSAWDKGKGRDTFDLTGRWLMTRDEIRDPQALWIWLDANDERMQDGGITTMAFSAKYLMAYVKQFITRQQIAAAKPASARPGGLRQIEPRPLQQEEIRMKE